MLSVALFSAAFAQAATVDTLSVWSASMNKGVEVVVVVPDGARTKTGPAYLTKSIPCSTCCTVTAAMPPIGCR